MTPETFTLYLHNISGGRDCRGLEHPAVKPGEYNIDAYLDLYQQQTPRPDILVLTEAHSDIPPEFDPGDGSANSEMIKVLSEGLGLPNVAVHAHSASHLDPEKSLSTAVLSRYPINSSEAILLPNPGLSYEVYPGVVWETYDKKLQVTDVQIPSGPLEIAAYHGVPMHRFGELLYSADNPAKFADYRQGITNALLPPQGTRRVTAGDFNNRYVNLIDAFPGLLGPYAQAIRNVSTMPRHFPGSQFDHVLYQPEAFRTTSRTVHETPSDHSLLIVRFSPRRSRIPGRSN